MPIMKMMKPAVLILTGLLLLAAPTWGQSYKVSEEKRELIRRFSKSICQLAKNNAFGAIKSILKKAGVRYLGEEITIEEAYPYIRCNEMFADNIDLFRVVAENPQLISFTVNFIFHFTEDVADKSLFGKILHCRKDFGTGCVDVLEHVEKNRKKRSSHASLRRKYDKLSKILVSQLARVDLGSRDLQFCREVLDEPPHCQAEDDTRGDLNK